MPAENVLILRLKPNKIAMLIVVRKLAKYRGNTCGTRRALLMSATMTV